VAHGLNGLAAADSRRHSLDGSRLHARSNAPPQKKHRESKQNCFSGGQYSREKEKQVG
jgi:hypothetical protein